MITFPITVPDGTGDTVRVGLSADGLAPIVYVTPRNREAWLTPDQALELASVLTIAAYRLGGPDKSRKGG